MIGALLLVSSLAGLLVPAVVLAYFREQIDWSKELAGPTWDFGKSWASNITAAGPVLGHAALLACFSPTPHNCTSCRAQAISRSGPLPGDFQSGSSRVHRVVANIASSTQRGCGFHLLLTCCRGHDLGTDPAALAGSMFAMGAPHRRYPSGLNGGSLHCPSPRVSRRCRGLCCPDRC